MSLTTKSAIAAIDKCTAKKKETGTSNSHYHQIDEIYDELDDTASLSEKDLETYLEEHPDDFHKDPAYGWGWRKKSPNVRGFK